MQLRSDCAFCFFSICRWKNTLRLKSRHTLALSLGETKEREATLELNIVKVNEQQSSLHSNWAKYSGRVRLCGTKKLQVSKGSQSSGASQTSIQACTLLATEGINRRTQESATSLVIMTTPICDASMQKRKRKKEKRKKIQWKQYLIISHIIVYWDNVGQHIFISAKQFHKFIRLLFKGVNVLVLQDGGVTQIQLV